MHKIIGDYSRFVEAIHTDLVGSGISLDDLAMMDHLCYRVETLQRYDELKRELSDMEEFIGEAQVGGRSIATFEFTDPLQAHGWRIPYLELPEPKDGSPYPEGLEHVEFVVLGGLQKFQQKYQELDFTTKGMSKKLNPELALKIGDSVVKFHEQPLGAVVRIEQRLGL